MMRLFNCIVVLIIFSGSKVKCQETELDPVVISTTLTPQKFSRTGRNVLVIKGEQFNQFPVHSVDELLRYLPGVEIQSRGPMGAQSDIVLRGGTFQQILVVLDGVRLNDPNTGHFTAYVPLPPSEIDHIEIVKGASSAVYGSEAVGGVIQIFTKSFIHTNDVKKKEFSVQSAIGEYSFTNINAGGFYSNGQTAMGAGILTNNTNGQLQRGTRGFVHNATGSFSIDHYFSKRWQLSARSSYDNRNFSAQNFYTSFVFDTASEKIKTVWNQVKIIYSAGKDRISLNAGYKDLLDHYTFNSGSTPNQNSSKLFQAVISNEWNIQTSTTVISGFQFINNKIVSNDRGDHRVDQAAAFAILNQQAGKNLFFSPGIRLEWNERSGWQFVPQINLSYHAGMFQLRGNAGKSIRDADFTERFNNYNKLFVSGGSVGNPDLLPEKSISYEAGADFFGKKNIRVSVTFFQRYYNNLIDFVNTPYSQMPRKDNLSPTGKYALAENIAKITTTGAETDIQYSKSMVHHQQLWSSIGLTWLSSTGNNGTPSFYISSHARFLSNFNLRYSSERIALSFNGLYKVRNPQTAAPGIIPVSRNYFMFNTKLEGFFIPHKLSAFLELDNIFNIRYSDLLGSQMPGKWFMVGLKINLIK